MEKVDSKPSQRVGVEKPHKESTEYIRAQKAIKARQDAQPLNRSEQEKLLIIEAYADKHGKKKTFEKWGK